MCINKANSLCLCCTFDDEPTTPVKAFKRENGKQWKEVANAKYNFLLQNKTWELVELAKGRKAIS
jgi:hypothetical protein